MRWLGMLVVACFVAGDLDAGDLQVARIFTDNAVLQQGVPCPVWGSASPATNVTVRFAGQNKTVQTASDGVWRLELAPMKSQAVGSSMVIQSGDQRVEFQNLLIGEVWYASGQSNMQMTLGACARRISEIERTVHAPAENSLRWLRVDEPDSAQPVRRREHATSWQQDRPELRASQSAVAYFFASHLQRELGVPIGVIEGSWGGKPIEGFIPRQQFENQPGLRSILSLADQDRLDELAKIRGGVIIRNTAGRPGRIFNARVAPIVPYALRGFIWYQGESNAGAGEDPREYRFKMKALVEGWRDAWGNAALPFYFVQLPAFKDQATGWARLREEQRLSLEIPHSGMAVTIDLRDSDIHPANKIDVGSRLANWALSETYGKRNPPSGPLFDSVLSVGDSLRVKFHHAGSGLMVARKEGLDGPIPTPNQALSHFELCDQDGIWHAAQATIEGIEVVVRSPGVLKPKAVRYACSGGPENANLYNQAGLPASPFCSDLELLPWALDR